MSATAETPAEASAACPVCGGAGFVRRERPVDHPRFGKAEPCDCVLDEADDVRRGRLERLSNLGSLTRFTFETLRPGGKDGDSRPFHAAFDAAAAYANDPVGWLVFSGPSGSGKTHLAAAIANQRIQAAEPVLFMVVADLLDHLRASYDAAEDELGYDQLFEQVRNAPLLILDDIDAVAGTAWAKEKLFQVVNHRFNAGLATVFTTTQRPAELEDRLGTRLRDAALSRVCALEGGHSVASYRQVGGMTEERLESMRFDTFDVRGASQRPDERDSLLAAFDAAMAFAREPRGWLTFQGTNGCGKTHLASAIANKVLGRGIPVFFAVVPDLLDALRSSFAPGSEEGYHELFEHVRQSPLLILDDLGAQRSAQWAEEKLYQIVNFRTLMMLPTVVTTDRSVDELMAAYPRVVSRINDGREGTFSVILAPHFHLGRSGSRTVQSRRAARS